MKRYDVPKGTKSKNSDITDLDDDEILALKLEKELKTVKQRIATRKHRERKNVR